MAGVNNPSKGRHKSKRKDRIDEYIEYEKNQNLELRKLLEEIAEEMESNDSDRISNAMNKLLSNLARGKLLGIGGVELAINAYRSGVETAMIKSIEYLTQFNKYLFADDSRKDEYGTQSYITFLADFLYSFFEETMCNSPEIVMRSFLIHIKTFNASKNTKLCERYNKMIRKIADCDDRVNSPVGDLR